MRTRASARRISAGSGAPMIRKESLVRENDRLSFFEVDYSGSSRKPAGKLWPFPFSHHSQRVVLLSRVSFIRGLSLQYTSRSCPITTFPWYVF